MLRTARLFKSSHGTHSNFPPKNLLSKTLSENLGLEGLGSIPDSERCSPVASWRPRHGSRLTVEGKAEDYKANSSQIRCFKKLYSVSEITSVVVGPYRLANQPKWGKHI